MFIIAINRLALGLNDLPILELCLYAFHCSALHNLSHFGISHCICCMSQVRLYRHGLLKCTRWLMTRSRTTMTLPRLCKVSDKRISSPQLLVVRFTLSPESQATSIVPCTLHFS